MFDEEKHRTHNSTYTQVGVQCFFESEVLNPSSVFLMKFSAKNPHLRVAAKRWWQVYKNSPKQIDSQKNEQFIQPSRRKRNT